MSQSKDFLKYDLEEVEETQRLLKEEKLFEESRAFRESQEIKQQDIEQKHKGKCQNSVVVICIILCIPLLMYIFNIDFKKSPYEIQQEKMEERLAGLANQRQDFYFGCRGMVNNRLRSPSGADFPDHINRVTSFGGTYKISSYVDGLNAFGVQIRTPWSCEITFVDGRSTNTKLSINGVSQ